MNAQQPKDGEGSSSNISSTLADGQRKRARSDEAHADEQAHEEKQPQASQTSASEASSVDERATRQSNLQHVTQAADHSAPLATSNRSGGSLVPVHAAAAPLGSAVQSTVAQPSAMLRCLALYRDVQFLLTQMLKLKDLGQLDTTCRAWRMWLLHPPLLAGLNQSLQGNWPEIRPVLQSRWLPQLITSVEQQTCQYTDEVGSSARFCDGSLDEQRRRCSQMLCTLPRCTRLRQLKLHMPDVPQATLDACFSGLAVSLRRLRIKTLAPDAQLLLPLLSALHPLRSIEKLEVQSQESMSELDFSALPQMLHLHSFALSCGDPFKDEWRCTPAQVQCLAQCRSLTSLACGRWSPDEREVDDDGWPLASAEQQIADGIGALVSGWLDASATASSASVHSNAAPAAATRVDLQSTLMTPAVWTHVSRLTSLTGIWPLGWSPDITAAQWARLAHFSQLAQLQIAPEPYDDWLQSDRIVPSLVQCSQLKLLCLDCMDLSREQLEAICTELLHLMRLNLQYVALEDCSPLSSAPALRKLSLTYCSGAGELQVQFRLALPTMAQLTQLRIDDREGEQLTEEQAAPLNAALLNRMPLLTLANFTQNLLPAEPAHVAAVAPHDQPNA